MVIILEITNIWQKSFGSQIFFLQILKNHRLVWIFLWIFGCYKKKLTKERATNKTGRK
jgi:hypothetical protein